MKRICLLLCCALMLQLVVGCGKQNEDLVAPVNFYYCNSEVLYNNPQSVICPEVREGLAFENDLETMLRAYIEGPQSSDLYSAIPKNVELISCQQHDDTVTVVFSGQLSKVVGVKLTTLCSALLMTLNEYTGVDVLRVQAEGERLEDRSEFVLTMSDLVLMDVIETEE